MPILTSYDLKGKKDSFANWISNLSPTDTYFVSTTGKEQIQNTLFQWQTDSLAAVDKDNAQDESSNAIANVRKTTEVYANKTQILRKAVEVTDTADAISSWGRGKELAYQMEKAGKEIKRDLEHILLSAQVMTPDDVSIINGGKQTGIPDTAAAGTLVVGAGTKDKEDDVQTGGAKTPRKTSCFQALVGRDSKTGNHIGGDHTFPDPDTKAVVWKKSTTANTAKEDELFDLTYNLYLANSDANIIMFHPGLAAFFSSLMETAPGGANANRFKMIENMDTTLNKFVGSVIDPLGQQFQLVPNRWMPEGYVYIFNPKDWTQMILREPQKVKLAKRGSTERYMIEMEVGLRHRNPYASGVYQVKHA
ncbi:MAG: SU10 major capsid protein [Fusobacteriaceae bacterium]